MLDRLEATLARREPALAELARELRWRTVRRAAGRGRPRGDRRGDGGAPRRARRRPRAGRPRPPHRRARGLPAAARPAAQPGRRCGGPAGGGDDPALLPHPPARAASSSGSSTACRSCSPPTSTAACATTSPPRSATRTSCPRRCARSATHASHAAGRRAAARRPLRARAGAAGPRAPAGRRRSPARRRARGVRARPCAGRGQVDVLTFGATPTGARRAPRRARPAPDDGRADGALAAVELRARAAARGARRLPVPCRRPRERARRAAGRARRGPRPHAGTRRGRPHHRAAGARADGEPGVRGDALGPVAPARSPAAAVEPRSCSTLAGDRHRRLGEAGAIIARFARETAGLGLELVMFRGRAAPWRGRARSRALRIFNPAGRGVVVEVADPPTQPLQPLDEGAQRIVSARRRGMLHPAEIVKILAPQRAEPRRRDHRPASSSSTTSTTTASSFPSSGRRRPTARASSSA